MVAGAARPAGSTEGVASADGDRAAGVFGVLATGYALLLGFVVFLAFTKYDESRAGAEAEALDPGATVRDGPAVPPSRAASCSPAS